MPQPPLGLLDLKIAPTTTPKTTPKGRNNPRFFATAPTITPAVTPKATPYPIVLSRFLGTRGQSHGVPVVGDGFIICRFVRRRPICYSGKNCDATFWQR